MQSIIHRALAKMGVDNLAHDDLARFSKLQRHMPAAFEGRRRFCNPPRRHLGAGLGRQAVNQHRTLGLTHI